MHDHHFSDVLFYMEKNEHFVGFCAAFWSIFLKKHSSQITHANHMTITTIGQI